MRPYILIVLLAYLSVGHCYTKYGRSCKDIGCPSNQMCVMESDPCSYYQRQGECGSYPTCKKTTNTVRTCSGYVCPPTKVCKMDSGTPKCVDDHSKVGHVGYDTQNQNNLGSGADNSGSSGNVYPSLPRGETTPRPNIYHQPASGSGYQGGAVGSGYPGQSGQRPYQAPAGGGYPQQTGAYPQQPGGYPQQPGGYPQQAGGYPQQAGGYPQQPGGYPQQGGSRNGYPQQGYYPGNQGGYQQGGYSNQYPRGYNQQSGYQQRYGHNSSPSFSDQITNSIKSIGLFCVLISYLMPRIYAGL